MQPLLLFDFDDTIAPSGTLGEQILVDSIIEHMGARYPEKLPSKFIVDYLEQEHIKSLTVEQKFGLLNEHFDLGLSVEDDLEPINEIRKERKIKAYEDGDITAYDNIAETLEVLSERGFDMAIASNGTFERIEKALSIFGLDKFFKGIFASNVFAKKALNIRPKPDGDLLRYAYHHTQEQTGNDYNGFIYIGDNNNDILAAKQAGAERVLIYMPKEDYNHLLAEEYKHKGAEIFTDYTDLPELISGGPSDPALARTIDPRRVSGLRRTCH